MAKGFSDDVRASIDGYRDACGFDPELPALLRAFPEDVL